MARSAFSAGKAVQLARANRTMGFGNLALTLKYEKRRTVKTGNEILTDEKTKRR